MSAAPPIILASKSFGRRKMLQDIGLTFESIPAQIDERAIEDKLETINAGHEDIALELAKEKALSVSAQHPGALVIGSDQLLECEGEVLHKAATQQEALDKLRFLSGKTHKLIASACLARGNEILWSDTDSASLTMHDLDEAFLEAYIEKAGAALLNCVGAYALEAEGAWLFSRIEGDYFTILGMPLLPLLNELRTQHGIMP